MTFPNPHPILHPGNSMNTSRRSFLKTTGLLAFPTIIPASARGADGTIAPSNRITLAAIGWGMQGPGDTNELMKLPDVQAVAACDLDKRHLEQAVNAINQRYSNSDCKGYKDFRELLARKPTTAACPSAN